MKSQNLIAHFSGFAEGGRTGYQVKAWVHGVEHTFDALKEIYDMRYSDAYFPYPCLGEMTFLFSFDDEGILVGVREVNNDYSPESPLQTRLILGTVRMFQVQITEDTPTVNQFVSIEGNTLTLTNFDEYQEKGVITSAVHTGEMPEPKNGMQFKLANDCVFYVWDWRKSTHPFCKCTREQAKEWNFTTRFELGCAADLAEKPIYWATFFSTRGDHSEIDLVKLFPNKTPGWTTLED